MSIRTTTTLVALAVLATGALACDTCAKDKIVGKAEILGNGLVWSWAKVDSKGNPIAIGISMTETALQGLPGKELMPPGPEPTMEIMLELPEKIKGKPFTQVGFHWNPVGHVPEGIYNVPHFDVHFYTIGEDIRTNITAVGDDLKVCQKTPDPKFVPASYILPPGTIVPRMGAHWITPSSPEFNGKPFTTTFLWGSYNGQPIFWEPMVTKAFLETKPNFTEDIKLPQAYEKPGYYPTRYTVTYNADRKEYSISLASLTPQGIAEAKVDTAAK
ncbi:MAG: hypothetical protein QOJ65_1751 [Fimbriimonadaceae bacterium]|jgi:hypothetical protein|nr:hypothetical protein [Fimbriimonadaceae bacterium]